MWFKIFKICYKICKQHSNIPFSQNKNKYNSAYLKVRLLPHLYWSHLRNLGPHADPTRGTLAPWVRGDSWESAQSQKAQIWETFFCTYRKRIWGQKKKCFPGDSRLDLLSLLSYLDSGANCFSSSFIANLSHSQPSLAGRTCTALYYTISRCTTQVLPKQTQVQTVITEWPAPTASPQAATREKCSFCRAVINECR